MQVPLCRHIRSNGLQCHAVALRNSVFCYFHCRLNHSPRLYRSITVCRPDPKRKGAIFDTGILKDHAAIQIAISRVVQALASNQMDLRHARSLLYGLQLAIVNTRAPDPINDAGDAFPEVLPSFGLVHGNATGVALRSNTAKIESRTPLRIETTTPLAPICPPISIPLQSTELPSMPNRTNRADRTASIDRP